MPFFIFFNQEALEKIIILSYNNIFSIRKYHVYWYFHYEKRLCFPKFLDISISRKGNKYFPCFHLEKMLIFLFSLLRKDTEMWHFLITKMSENPQKYHLFIYFHVFTPCEKMWFCVVLQNQKQLQLLCTELQTWQKPSLKTLTHPVQPVVITADQPVYALGKQLKWIFKDEFRDFVRMLGSLCIEQNFIRAIGWKEKGGQRFMNIHLILHQKKLFILCRCRRNQEV